LRYHFWDFRTLIWPHQLKCTLACFGSLGYLLLHFKTHRQRYRLLDEAESQLVAQFKKDEREKSDGTAAFHVHDEEPASTGPVKASGDGRGEVSVLGDAHVAILDLNCDGLREFLERKKIFMTNDLVLELFNKIDTSEDGLISARELKRFIDHWQHMSPATQTTKVVGKMFDFTGMCLFFMLISSVLNLGNALIWYSVDTELQRAFWDTSNVLMFFGVIGFIRLGIASVVNEVEDEEQTFNRLRLAIQSSQRIKECYSTTRWLRRLLASDVPPQKLRGWLANIENDPYARNLKVSERACRASRRRQPSRAEPSRAEPSRAEPSRAEPSRAEPSRAEATEPTGARACAQRR
jgi:hypothetical protein